MGEKRKSRPTWTMVRELEAEVARLRALTCESLQQALDEQMDGTSAVVRDCDAWRDEYRSLLKEKEAVDAKLSESEASRVRDLKMLEQVRSECEKTKDKMKTLEQSNSLLEKELLRMKSAIDSKEAVLKEQKGRLERLESRGLFARILNRL